MPRRKKATEPLILIYTGKKRIATSNELHSRWRWYNTGQYYRREFIDALQNYPRVDFKAFGLEVRYNTNHDPDNLSAVAKFFIDTLRELKYMKNDNREYYKYLNISYDSTLPKVTIEFKVVPQ